MARGKKNNDKMARASKLCFNKIYISKYLYKIICYLLYVVNLSSCSNASKCITSGQMPSQKM